MAERLGIDNLEFEKKHPVGVVHPLRIISKLPNINLKLESRNPNLTSTGYGESDLGPFG